MYAEAGRNDRAADVAEAYLKRRSALTLDEPDESAPLGPRGPACRGAHLGGRVPRQAGVVGPGLRLDVPPHLANLAWLDFYAATSVTPADALAALEALPRYSPLPRFDGDAYYERVMGQVLLLAGRVDDAIPYLRHAVSTCFGVYTILSHQVRGRDARRGARAEGGQGRRVRCVCRGTQALGPRQAP